MQKFYFWLDCHLFSAVSSTPWVPPLSLLYGVLVVGAFLTAGVALSVFTFYEDHYWNDQSFRDELRFEPSRRPSSSRKFSKL